MKLYQINWLSYDFDSAGMNQRRESVVLPENSILKLGNGSQVVLNLDNAVVNHSKHSEGMILKKKFNQYELDGTIVREDYHKALTSFRDCSVDIIKFKLDNL